jgi:PII-like signaling protein
VLPGVIIVVDTAEKIAALVPALAELIPAGMMVQSEVDVVFYRPAM